MQQASLVTSAENPSEVEKNEFIVECASHIINSPNHIEFIADGTAKIGFPAVYINIWTENNATLYGIDFCESDFLWKKLVFPLEPTILTFSSAYGIPMFFQRLYFCMKEFDTAWRLYMELCMVSDGFSLRDNYTFYPGGHVQVCSDLLHRMYQLQTLHGANLERLFSRFEEMARFYAQRLEPVENSNPEFLSHIVSGGVEGLGRFFDELRRYQRGGIVMGHDSGLFLHSSVNPALQDRSDALNKFADLPSSEEE